MVIDPMPTADLAVLLVMIEPSWGNKRAMVQHIGTVEGGDWFTADDVADLVGCTPAWCRRQLPQLERAKVILRDGGDGGRLFWCEVNPDWEQWQVPWRWPKRAVRQKLADIRERRSTPALMRFIARPRSARYAEISARLRARDEAMREAAEAAENAITARHRARANALPAPTDRAPWGARAGEADRAPIERALIERIDDLHTLFSGVLTNSATKSPESEQQESAQQPHQRPDVRKVIAAIEARSTRVYPGSSLERVRIPDLVARWGVDQILGAIPRVDAPGAKSPAFVDALEALLERDRKHDELRELKRNLAALQATSGGVPTADHIRLEALCEELGESPLLPLPIVVEPPTWETAPEIDHQVAHHPLLERVRGAREGAESGDPR